MSIWLYIGSILTLALGLSIAELTIGSRIGAWPKILRYFLVFIAGTVIAAVTMVLIVIAVWPPFSIIALTLPVAFFLLLLVVLNFVRAADIAVVEEKEEAIPLCQELSEF